MATKAPLSDYEKARLDNIRERENMFKDLFQEIKQHSEAIAPAVQRKTTAKRKVRDESDPDFMERKSIRLAKKLSQSQSPPRTRARAATNGTDSSDEPRMVVKFPFYKKWKAEDIDDNDDFIVYDEEEVEEGSIPCPPLPTREPPKPRAVLSPDEITDQDLDNVVENFGAKIYNQKHGTTCHQCRQKTLDMKTICRGPDCRGMRGAFCGPCLKIRYGEDAREALKDPTWICPACKGICNCSICRRRSGYNCTGILIHTAQEQGFKSVADYLQSLKKQ